MIIKTQFLMGGMTIQPLLVICFLFLPFPSFAEQKTSLESNQTPERQAHIDLIEIALLTDAYNKRCRGISISKSLNQVNRLYVTKYSLTANNFIKTYIDPDVKTLKLERQHAFNKLLNQLGGCQAVKKNGSITLLKKHFRTQYESVEKSSWYPE